MAGYCIRGLFFFSLFFSLYFFPVLLGFDWQRLEQIGGYGLWNELMSLPEIKKGIVINFMGHGCIVFFAFLVLILLGEGVSSRLKIDPWIGGLLVVSVGWFFLVAANGFFFSLSNYSVPLGWVASKPVLFLSGGVLGVLVSLNGWRYVLLGGGVVLLAGFFWSGVGKVSATPTPTSKNVILIGVDSLSAAIFERYKSDMPNLAALVGGAQLYRRAYTPLGRTFPAWVSILSGKPPIETGAFFNLRSIEMISRKGLLPAALREKGYQTVFAIDERRFANIDESFGFDSVIGPRVGVLDFLLQRLNDAPLSNMVLQMKLGKYLLPYSYVNTASYSNYSMSMFVRDILGVVEDDKPIFLAVHFESAHFPYRTRHAGSKSAGEDSFLARHVQALTVVDKQVKALMDGLREKKRLDNALVVFLSDHGEGLGLVEREVSLDGESRGLSSYGHGADLLSDYQNRILLGWIDYRNGKPSQAPLSHKEQVSLLNIRPLVEQYVANDLANMGPLQPCMVVETGLRIESASDYRSLKESQVVADSFRLYKIDETGRLSLREAELPGLLAAKDVGWRCLDRLTWYSPKKRRYYAFLLDENGLPVQQITPDSNAVSQIEKYYKKYGVRNEIFEKF